MRSPALFFAACVLNLLCGTGSFAQSLTDPKELVSPVRPTFIPLGPRELSVLDEPGYPIWSPDGRFIAYVSLQTGVANVWIIDVATKKSRPAAPVDGSQLSPRWSPDGRQILYIADDRGDELYDIYLIDLASGQIRNLTQTTGYAETCAGWSPDGREIVFSSRAKDSPSGEIAVIDIASRKTRFLTSGGSTERSRVSPLWAPTGDYIYFYDRAWSRLDTNIMRVRSSGESVPPENLTPHEGESLNQLADVSRDGRHVLFASTAATGWMNVAMLDTRTRKQRWITRENSNHIPVSFSPDGALIAFTRDDAMTTQIFLHAIASRTTRQLTRGAGLNEATTPFPTAMTSLGGSRFSPDGKHLIYLNAATRPGDLMMIATEGAAEDMVLSTTPPEMERSFVSPVAVRFQSADRRFDVPALVWIPPNLKRDGSHPAVVEVHGGPAQQTRPYLNTYIQVLVSQGYLVISPNYRGSVNYDLAFQRANHGDPAGGELNDVSSAADWLIGSGYVDPKRVAVYGASWGGYLTLMALSTQPDRWAAGVALYPVADLHTWYKTSAPWIQSFARGLVGDPVRNESLWRDRSPLTHAARIRAPVLMNAGVNDTRSPLGQIKAMERAIRANDAFVELRIIGDTGHGVEDTGAYADENTMVVDFLNRHLRQGQEPAPDAR